MFEEFKGTGIPIPTPKKPSGDFLKKLPKIVLIVVIVLVLLAVVASSWYTVNDKEQAVVTTFGKVTDITDAGFHFKLPFGIQKVEKVNVNVYQKIELGYRSVGSADNFDIIESETKMITGDYNIVDVEFFVEYKVSDRKSTSTARMTRKRFCATCCKVRCATWSAPKPWTPF